MTKEEADEIIDLRLNYEDKDCTCHMHPPCPKCTEMPSDEEYEHALKILGEK